MMSRNNAVVVIYKTHAEATRAREIINRTNPEALEEHQPSRTSTEACAVGGSLGAGRGLR